MLIVIRAATIATAYCLALVATTLLPGQWAPPWWLLLPAVPVALAGAVVAQRNMYRRPRSWNRSWLALTDDFRAAAALPRRLQVLAAVAGATLLLSTVASMPMVSRFGLEQRGGRYWRNESSGRASEISQSEYWRSRAATDRVFFGLVGWFCLASAAVQEGRRRSEGTADMR